MACSPKPTITDITAAAALAQVTSGDCTTADLAALIATTDPLVEQRLFAAADQARREQAGDGVHLRALIEFSNYCRNTCFYCGLRAANAGVERYRLTPDEIFEAATEAVGLGYRTVVLQSGEDPWYTREMVADLVGRIKALGVAVTLCLGERPREDYAAWKEAGADRYLVRIETSDPELYARLHPGMSFDNRVRCLRDLKDLGYQVGSGLLLGLPGQTAEDHARDLLFLRDLGADMVGMGPFIPHPDTPLADAPPCGVPLVLRMIALARLLLPKAYIVATTALGTIDPMGREKGLQVGADVMMPNVTPRQFRASYEIYPDKICVGEEPTQCRGCTERRLQAIGRHIAGGCGHAADRTQP